MSDERLRAAVQRLVDEGPQWSPHSDVKDRVPRDPVWGLALVAVADLRAALFTPDPAPVGLDVERLRRAWAIHRERQNAGGDSCDFHCAEGIAAEYARLSETER